MTKTKYKNVRRCPINGFIGQKRHRGKTVIAVGKTALDCAKHLNFNCKRKKFPLPNPSVPLQEGKCGVNAASPTKYNNVNKKPNGRFQGFKSFIGKRVSVQSGTALSCARMLNYKCREQEIPLANPSVGFTMPKSHRKKRRKVSIRRKKLMSKMGQQARRARRKQVRKSEWEKAEIEFGAKIQVIADHYAKTAAAESCHKLLKGMRKYFKMPQYRNPTQMSWPQVRKMGSTVVKMRGEVRKLVNAFYEKWENAIGLDQFPEEILDLNTKIMKIENSDEFI